MAFPYIIARNDVFGRYLIAGRDIKQGEVIMREVPLVIGSQQTSILICFMCAEPIDKSRAVPCGHCHIVPVCGMCSGQIHEEECPFIQKLHEMNMGNMRNCTFSFLCDNPSTTMVIRCLLLKYSNEKSWKEMMQLESHLAERKDKYVYNLLAKMVEEPLEQLHLFDNLKQVAEGNDLVQRICGILDVNSFELRQSKAMNRSNMYLRGLFLKPALMSHNCQCNTLVSVDDDYVMIVRASVPIQKDDTISFNYTNCLEGTAQRQLHLQEGKYFTCQCRRCLDPTELGTGLSSLICPLCKVPELICELGNWKCLHCSKEYNRCMINSTLSIAREHVQESVRMPNLVDLSAVMALLLRTFHRNHSFLVEVYLIFVSLREHEQDMTFLEKKLSICEQLAELFRCIEPGISRHQGIALYELHRSKLRLGKMQFNASLISWEIFSRILLDTMHVLKEAIMHLIHEPKSSPEGRLVQEAFTDMHVLRSILNDGAKRNCA